MPRILVGGSELKDAWDDETLAVFADSYAEPAPARAAVQMYRVFNWRELLPLLRGGDSWFRPCSSSAPTTSCCAPRCWRATGATRTRCGWS